MKVSDAFPSKYLKVDDLHDRDVPVTIAGVVKEQVGPRKQDKLVLYFKELDKPLPINKTNATVIAKLYGDETDHWTGKRITLWPNHEVEFQGELVSAIRIRARAPEVDSVSEGAGPTSPIIDELRRELYERVMEAVAGDIGEAEQYLLALTGKADVDALNRLQVEAAIKKIAKGWAPSTAPAAS